MSVSNRKRLIKQKEKLFQNLFLIMYKCHFFITSTCSRCVLTPISTKWINISLLILNGIFMKQRNKIICIVMLFTISLTTISPVLGSTTQANHLTLMPLQTGSPQYVIIDFVDCTNIVPIRKEVAMLKTEWISLRNELRAISTGLSVRNTLSAQLAVYQKHGLVSPQVTSDSLFRRFNTNSLVSERKMHASPLNDSVINAMCAILLDLTNGTTAVFGLNSFINLIGFDIISAHKGYATQITTTGLLGQRSAPAGTYAGTMFGFFGYWSGTKVKTGVYSDLTASGFTVFTLWVPLQK